MTNQIKDVIAEAAGLQNVREYLDASTYHGALDVLLAVVERHIEAIDRVRELDTAVLRWCRQGSGNQADRDRWNAAIKEHDDADRYLRQILAARKA